MCSDQLPISLDWSHTKGIRKSLNGSSRCPERMSTYVFPRRLTYEDRLRRLYGHDIDVDDDDDDDSSIFSFLQSTDFRFAMPSATEIHRSTRRSLMDEIDYYDEEEGHAHHSPKEVIYCPHILQDDGEEDDGIFSGEIPPLESLQDQGFTIMNWGKKIDHDHDQARAAFGRQYSLDFV